MTTPAPGWYPDPSDPSAQRYWDGAAWTDHTQGPAAAAAPPAPAAPAAPSAVGSDSSFNPWLWQSVVATLLCCLPLGVAGIVFAAQAKAAHGAGDMATAATKSAAAKKLTIASIVIGLVLTVAIVALEVMATGTAAPAGTF